MDSCIRWACLCAGVALMGCLACAVEARADPQYVELGTLGGAYADAEAISADGGTVVGASETVTASRHAFLWRAKTNKMIDLGAANLGPSTATAVNANGTVAVGYASPIDTLDTNSELPFRWKAGKMTLLQPLGAAPKKKGTGRAWGVSATGGTVVGGSTTSTGNLHAFLWTVGSGMIDLGTAAPAAMTTAFAISENAWTVAGLVELNQPVVWMAGGAGMQMHVLPMPQGAAAAAPLSVNANGSLVAGAAIFGTTWHGIIWALKSGHWTIVGDADDMSFYGVAGSHAEARAVGVGGPTEPAHAMIADLHGSLTWTDANDIPNLTPKPVDRVLRIGEGVSRDGTAIAGNSSAVPDAPAQAQRAFFISGLKKIGGIIQAKKPPIVRRHFEVTCPAPCRLGPPPSREQLVVLEQFALDSTDGQVSPNPGASRLRLIFEQLLQARKSRAAR